MVKKIWKMVVGVQVALLVLLLSVTPVAAAEIRGSDDVIIASGDVVNDDLYMAGNRIVINGVVNGDVMAAGSTVTVAGTINGDLVALASSVVIEGDITGSVRAAASSIRFSGTIGEDLVIAGSSIQVDSASEIGKDLVFGGSNVKIGSTVVGDILGAGDVVRLSDIIGGDAEIAVNRLVIASTATINGDLVYTSENEADISPDAFIAGETTWKIPAHDKWYHNWSLSPAVKFWSKVISYLMVLLVGIIIVLVAPRKSTEAANKLRTKPLKSLGWGALLLIVTPIAIAISVLTVIGIPLGIAGTLLYGALIFISQLVIGFFIGYWIIQRLNMEETRGSLVLALFIGFTLLTLVKLIPVVGWIVWWVTVLFGIGAIALLVERKKKEETVVAEVIEETQG